MQVRRRSAGLARGRAAAERTTVALSAAVVIMAALAAAALPAAATAPGPADAAGTASAFTPGEGTGTAWCPGYGGINLGSYKDVYACAPKNKKAGKTPFDNSYAGFQCTELANRFLYNRTGRTLFANEEGGNYVALAAAAFSIPDAASGAAGRRPAGGDIISMWGGRSGQKQNGSRTQVAVVTKVTKTPSGWTITTLNQGGDPSVTARGRGFDTITVSANGKTWSALNGFYAAFDWLKLVRGKSSGGGTGGGGGGGGGGGSGGGGTGSGSASWSASQAPLRTGAQTGQLLAVACGSAMACTAVGAGDGAALLVYGAGASWKAATVPVPSSDATGTELTAVTCMSAANCLAAGQYHSAGRQQGMLLAGHGASWTATRAPLPASAAAHPHVILSSVACASASSCVAAGQYFASGSAYGLLVVGHDSSWQAFQAPLPADAAGKPAARLTSVTCTDGGDCVAVGNYLDKPGNEQGFIVTGSGSAWSSYRAALPASAVTPGAALTAVTCPTASKCVAAGSFSANSRGMILTGWGASWTAVSTPLPSGAAANPAAAFRQISCLSATACVAVGSYSASGAGRQGLLVSGRGSSWSAASARLPAGAAANQGTPGAGLVSVACATATTCVAAGNYTDTAGDGRVLLLTWGGSSWAVAKGPLPANSRTVGSQAQGSLGPPDLASVACPAATACVAVGTYPARRSGLEGLVEAGRL
jgi:hypothetical protein